MNLEFFPVDIEQYLHKGKVVVALFGRTIDGKKVCVIDESYQPYFFVVVDEDADTPAIEQAIAELKFIDREENSIYQATATEITKKSVLGKGVTAIKISINDPRGMKKFYDAVKRMRGVHEIYEADVTWIRRYVIDKNITPLLACIAEGEETNAKLDVDITILAEKIEQKGDVLIKDPKILAFDIEVYNERRYPNEEHDPIVLLAFYGSDGFAKVITWKQFSNPKKHIEFVNDEGELIVRFRDIINEYKPDYLVGYFSDGFDLPYIRARADKYKIKLTVGLDRSEIRFIRRANNFSVKIKGIAHVDIYKFIKRMMYDVLDVESFDLDNVARALLGEGKSDVDINNLATAWNSDVEHLREFCEYNLNDAKITFRLMNLMLPNLNEIVKLVSQPIYDVCRMSYGQLVEWYLIKQLRQFNELTPRRPARPETVMRRIQSYEGGFVYEPEPGLYKDIIVFDFRSLYPSIISAHNICPSTLTTDVHNAHESPVIEVDGQKRIYFFNYKRDGFIPAIVKDIIQRRIRIKEIIKGSEGKPDPVLNARQNTLKILANSFYGYLGFPGARWYSKECAASIAAYGREYIKDVITKAQLENFKVCYADTDSTFIALQKKSRDDAMELLKKINEVLPSLMELEFQGFYPRGIFVMKKSESSRGAKKKYALVDEKGKVKVTGFETIRGDWSYVAKEVQNKVFELVLRDNDVEAAVAYVKGVIKKIEKRELPTEEMVIQKQLRKDIGDYDAIGPHVAAAQRMRDLGMYVGQGSTIRYIIEEGTGALRDRARLLSESKAYDQEYYIHNQIIPAVEKIFEVLGYKKDVFIHHDQKNLGEF